MKLKNFYRFPTLLLYISGSGVSSQPGKYSAPPTGFSKDTENIYNLRKESRPSVLFNRPGVESAAYDCIFITFTASKLIGLKLFNKKKN